MAWQGLLCTAALLLTAPAMALADSARFDIAAQPMPAALKAFAAQAHMQLLYRYNAVQNAHGNAVSGELEKHAALEQLLRDSGLEVVYSSDSAATIRPIKTDAETTAKTNDAEGAQNKSFWDRFRVAQVDPGKVAGVVSVSGEDEATIKKKNPVQLEEVVITGSRLPQTVNNGAQDVAIYTNGLIEQSGRTSIPDFLNTLPSVSIASVEQGFQAAFGSTTVQLRGLPIGTTLVLIDGRRVQTSGSQAGLDFFDLNNIPLAAVERIEVIADGSSAIYGSDAIAGVVNIILKKNLEGLEVSAKYGGAVGIDEANGSIAWARHWERGGISIVGSYATRSELSNYERSITASSDFSSFGGPNKNRYFCNPGNVFSPDQITPLPGLGGATYAAVPVGFAGTPSIDEFKGTAGSLNRCSIYTGFSEVPASNRTGVFAEAHHDLSTDVVLFAQLMYSHVQQFEYTGYQALVGRPTFQQYTVSPTNPYNPFGTTVGISDLFTSLPRTGELSNADYFRPTLGARGSFFHGWTWEASAWESVDFTHATLPLVNADSTAIQNALNSSNPSTALNPFVAGPPGPQALLRSFFKDGHLTFAGRGEAANAFIRGPALHLPAGAVQVVVGGEFDRDVLSSDDIDGTFGPPNTRTDFHRTSYAVFGEARVPVWASHSNEGSRDILAVTVAGRYDHYSDFGTKNTPQFGVELRPLKDLLLRATYSEAFKAPSLFDLHAPQVSFPGTVPDPLTGQDAQITVIQGGNPNLRSQTGQSHTLGFVYSNSLIPDLRLSVTHWKVSENNAIQAVPLNTIVDNPGLFPGDVVRGPPGPNGQPGQIITVFDGEVNFGRIDVAGFDYSASYDWKSQYGVWSPTIAASETYRYSSNLTPGSPSVDGTSVAQDTGNWAPRWKGTVALNWHRGAVTAHLAGRYVGRYQDYDSSREIGNFWLCDANVRVEFGELLSPANTSRIGTYFEAGGINILDRLPQYSNFGFGFVGYDIAQADIRGRFVYARLGLKW